MRSVVSVNVDHIDDVYTRVRMRKISLADAARQLVVLLAKGDRISSPVSRPVAAGHAVPVRMRRKK